MANDLVRLVEQVKVTRRIRIPKGILRYVAKRYIKANNSDIKPLLDYRA